MKKLALYLSVIFVFPVGTVANACENSASTEFMREKGQQVTDLAGSDCNWSVREKKQNIPEPKGNSNYQNRMPTDAELDRSNIIKAQEKFENQTQDVAQNAGGGENSVQQQEQVVEEQSQQETDVIRVKDKNNQVIQGNGGTAVGCGSGMGVCNN